MDDLRERLDAVERALTDGDGDLSALAEGAATADRVADLESDVEDLRAEVRELQAATQALRGYVGNVRSVNEAVERKAERALERVEAMEAEQGRTHSGSAPGEEATEHASHGGDHEANLGHHDESRGDHDASRGAHDEHWGDHPPEGLESGTSAEGRSPNRSALDRAVEASESLDGDHTCHACGRPRDQGGAGDRDVESTDPQHSERTGDPGRMQEPDPTGDSESRQNGTAESGWPPDQPESGAGPDRAGHDAQGDDSDLEPGPAEGTAGRRDGLDGFDAYSDPEVPDAALGEGGEGEANHRENGSGEPDPGVVAKIRDLV